MFTEVHCLILGTGWERDRRRSPGQRQQLTLLTEQAPRTTTCEEHSIMGRKTKRRKWRRSGDWKLLQRGPLGLSPASSSLNTLSLLLCVWLSNCEVCSGGTGTLSHAQ